MNYKDIISNIKHREFKNIVDKRQFEHRIVLSHKNICHFEHPIVLRSTDI